MDKIKELYKVDEDGKDWVRQSKNDAWIPGYNQIKEQEEKLVEAQKTSNIHLHYTYDCEGCQAEIEETEQYQEVYEAYEKAKHKIKELEEQIRSLKLELFYKRKK